MVLAADKERVKVLLKDTITLLCRNGLAFKSKFSIEALIGVTLDDEDIFLVSINELIKNELEKSAEKSRSSSDESVEDSGSGEDALSQKQHRNRKRKRNKHLKVKREPGAYESSDGDDGQGDDSSSEPMIKKQPPDDSYLAEQSGSTAAQRSRQSYDIQQPHGDQRSLTEPGFDDTADNPDDDDDSEDIVFIKQEVDTWSQNAANASQANLNFSQGANGSQSDINFSSLSDMSLIPVTSQEEGSMVWPSGIQQRRSFPGRTSTVTSGGSTLPMGDGQLLSQQPQQVCTNIFYHLC